MNATLITIGEELLIGQVIDTNSAWLGQQLNALGIRVQKRVSVPDNPESIAKAFQSCLKESNIIISTGGLGPTSDDKTKDVLCKIFDSTLIEDSETVEHVRRFFADRNLPLSEVNRKQAWIPDKAKIMKNTLGTAPGLYFNIDNKHIFVLPGVPFEMKMLFELQVSKIIKLHSTHKVLVHETITVSGIGESFLSDKIKEWENKLPQNISLAYLPSPGLIRLRLSIFSDDELKSRNLLKQYFSELMPQIKDYYVSDRDEKMHETLFRLLKTKKKSISTAESCSGGYLASLLTSIPGSSEIYKGSIIAYDNKVKIQSLNVKANTLEMHGAVSREVVCEMSKNIREIMHTDYAIATSGIAGPSGGTKEKPVGFIWIAIADKNMVYAQNFQFGKFREVNIIRSSVEGINMIIKHIRKG